MSEVVDGFKSMPEKVVLSGQGLRDMELSHFNTIVRILTSIDVQVETLAEPTQKPMTKMEDDEMLIPKSVAVGFPTSAEYRMVRTLAEKAALEY